MRKSSYILSKKPTYYLPPAPENSKYKPPKSEIKKFHQLYELYYTNEPKFKWFFYKLKVTIQVHLPNEMKGTAYPY